MKSTIRILLLFFFIPITMTAAEMGDSIDVYENQTVTTTVFVQGRDTIGVRNVTVMPSGKLTMIAPGGIRVSNDLYVQMGGRLELHGAHQWPITYIYDANGNTTARRKE